MNFPSGPLGHQWDGRTASFRNTARLPTGSMYKINC